MPRQLGPRFALEAAFLILVAVGAGLLDLRPLLIVLVMGIAWLLVALMEYAASRGAPLYGPRMPTPVFGRVVEDAPVVESEIVRERPTLLEGGATAPVRDRGPVEGVPGEPGGSPAPEAAAGSVEREAPTGISHPRSEPAEVAPESVLEPEEDAAEREEREEQAERAEHFSTAEPSSFTTTAPRPPMRYRLEPLQPRPKRRFWERFRRSEDVSGDSSSGVAEGEPGDES